MGSLFIGLAVCAALPVLPLAASAQDTTKVLPSKDNTIYSGADLSNGLGEHLFAGISGQGRTQRALLAFDLASEIPEGATVLQVELDLYMSRSQPLTGSQDVSLHRLTRDWGEGTAKAGSGEGGGAPALGFDATWEHAFYNTVFWDRSGGDFVASPSATESVGDLGPYTWRSTDALVQDVQLWVDSPQSNFGWILIGGESAGPSSKRFGSRQNENPLLRPVLTVTYTTDPVQTIDGTWGRMKARFR